MRTFVNTDRQIFGDNLTTARTHLRSVARVNLYYCSASFFRFARTALYKLTPCSVRDALVHATPVAILHTLDIQLLKGDDLELIHQSPAQFVGKVLAASSNAVVNMLDNTLVLAALRRTFATGRESALCFRQRLFGLAEKPRILNSLSSTESCKVSQAHINPNDFIGRRQRLRFYDTREAGIPVAQRISSDSQCLNYTFEGPVQSDLDVSDLRDPQPSVIKQPKSTLRESEAVVTVPATEPWVARRIPSFYSTEESSKREINTSAYVLQTLRVSSSQKRIFRFPSRKHIASVVTRKRFLSLLPSITTHFQRFVIDPPTSIKRLLHLGSLATGWVKTESKCLAHITTIALLYGVVKHIRRLYLPFERRTCT